MSPFKSEVVTSPLVLKHGDSAALIILPDAVECPLCHRMVRLAVNRNGKSACVACDEIAQQALQTSAPTK